MPYKRKTDNELFKSDDEIAKIASKTKKSISEKNVKNEEIQYEIVGNENDNIKELIAEHTYNKKYIAKSIPFPEEFNVKMILGSPQKIRATAARIIKAGARGEIPQQHVNSLIWQLRSLIYFDQSIADLTDHATLVEIAKVLKKEGKL